MSRHRKNEARVLAAIAARDISRDEIAAELGIGMATAWRWVQELEETHKIHVCERKVHPHGGPLINVYRIGRRPPKFRIKQPKILGDSERVARYRQRLKQSTGWDDMLERQRNAYWRDKPVAAPKDPLFSLFK
jgi:predicted ArsR family transcriptional regulator